jgi:hypothetical protein
MKASKKDAVSFANPVGDNCALLELQSKRSADQLLRSNGTSSPVGKPAMPPSMASVSA